MSLQEVAVLTGEALAASWSDLYSLCKMLGE